MDGWMDLASLQLGYSVFVSSLLNALSMMLCGITAHQGTDTHVSSLLSLSVSLGDL